MAPAPHQRRVAVGIDLGTTNSLVAAVRSSVPEVLPDEDGHVLLPSVVRYLEKGGRRIGRDREGRSGDRSAQHDRVGQALHGPRQERSGGRRERAVRFHRRARHGADPHRRRREEPGRSVGGNSRDAALSRRRHARRRSRRRGDHGARLFRRSAAPGDQGRRASRRPERAAPAERADRGRDRLRSRQRVRRPVRRVRPRRRHVRPVDSEAHQGRVRSARGGRRLRARRRRFRSRAVSPCAGAGGHRAATLAPEDVRLLLDRVRAAKEALSDAPEATRRRRRFRTARRSIVDDHRSAIRDAHRSARRSARSTPTRKALRDAKVDAAGHQGRRAGRRRDAHAGDPPRGRGVLRPAAAHQSRSGSGRRARRRDPGRSARRQPSRATATTGCCST